MPTHPPPGSTFLPNPSLSYPTREQRLSEAARKMTIRYRQITVDGQSLAADLCAKGYQLK